MALTPGGEPSRKNLVLIFDSAAEGQHWYDTIRDLQSSAMLDASQADRPVPEGVALVRQTPDVQHVPLGRVAFVSRTSEAADRGIQLRAGRCGADAVMGLYRQKCPELGWGARRVSGLAIRVQDADDRKRLRWKWYAEEVSALTNRILALVLILACLHLVAAVYLPGKSRFVVATGLTPSEWLASVGGVLGLLFAWPLGLLVLVRILRRRELLRAAGIAVLAVTTILSSSTGRRSTTRA
jgi:hypothetical protein